jgi:predicted  nucleic acid-binding Zn-ribbon protein
VSDSEGRARLSWYQLDDLLDSAEVEVQRAHARANEAARLSADARDRADDLEKVMREQRDTVVCLRAELDHWRRVVVPELIAEREALRAEVVRLGKENDELHKQVADWRDSFGGEPALRDALVRRAVSLARSGRTWTYSERRTNEAGRVVTRMTVKRACNGCGVLLGDVTEAEIDGAVAGEPMSDVRGECPTCTPFCAAAAAPEDHREAGT